MENSGATSARWLDEKRKFDQDVKWAAWPEEEDPFIEFSDFERRPHVGLQLSNGQIRICELKKDGEVISEIGEMKEATRNQKKIEDNLKIQQKLLDRVSTILCPIRSLTLTVQTNSRPNGAIWRWYVAKTWHRKAHQSALPQCQITCPLLTLEMDSRGDRTIRHISACFPADLFTTFSNASAPFIHVKRTLTASQLVHVLREPSVFDWWCTVSSARHSNVLTVECTMDEHRRIFTRKRETGLEIVTMWLKRFVSVVDSVAHVSFTFRSNGKKDELKEITELVHAICREKGKIVCDQHNGECESYRWVYREDSYVITCHSTNEGWELSIEKEYCNPSVWQRVHNIGVLATDPTVPLEQAASHLWERYRSVPSNRQTPSTSKGFVPHERITQTLSRSALSRDNFAKAMHESFDTSRVTTPSRTSSRVTSRATSRDRLISEIPLRPTSLNLAHCLRGQVTMKSAPTPGKSPIRTENEYEALFSNSQKSLTSTPLLCLTSPVVAGASDVSNMFSRILEEQDLSGYMIPNSNRERGTPSQTPVKKNNGDVPSIGNRDSQKDLVGSKDGTISTLKQEETSSEGEVMDLIHPLRSSCFVIGWKLQHNRQWQGLTDRLRIGHQNLVAFRMGEKDCCMNIDERKEKSKWRKWRSTTTVNLEEEQNVFLTGCESVLLSSARRVTLEMGSLPRETARRLLELSVECPVEMNTELLQLDLDNETSPSPISQYFSEEVFRLYWHASVHVARHLTLKQVCGFFKQKHPLEDFFYLKTRPRNYNYLSLHIGRKINSSHGYFERTARNTRRTVFVLAELAEILPELLSHVEFLYVEVIGIKSQKSIDQIARDVAKNSKWIKEESSEKLTASTYSFHINIDEDIYVLKTHEWERIKGFSITIRKQNENFRILEYLRSNLTTL